MHVDGIVRVTELAGQTITGLIVQAQNIVAVRAVSTSSPGQENIFQLPNPIALACLPGNASAAATLAIQQQQQQGMQLQLQQSLQAVPSMQLQSTVQASAASGGAAGGGMLLAMGASANTQLMQQMQQMQQLQQVSAVAAMKQQQVVGMGPVGVSGGLPFAVSTMAMPINLAVQQGTSWQRNNS